MKVWLQYKYTKTDPVADHGINHYINTQERTTYQSRDEPLHQLLVVSVMKIMHLKSHSIMAAWYHSE